MSERELTQDEIDANVAKANAEARKFDSEARHYDLMAEHASELVKQAREQSKVAVFETRSAKILLDQTVRQEKHILATNFNNKQMVYDGEVNFKNVRYTIEQLSIWARENPGEDLEFVINSPGGEMVSGYALVDFILALRAQGHNVTTLAIGAAMSMAAILLQSGTTRVMGRHALMLIHDGSMVVGGTMAQIEDATAMAEKLRNKAYQLISERATPINAKTTVNYLKKMAARRDWYLTAEEALALGLIDQIR